MCTVIRHSRRSNAYAHIQRQCHLVNRIVRCISHPNDFDRLPIHQHSAVCQPCDTSKGERPLVFYCGGPSCPVIVKTGYRLCSSISTLRLHNRILAWNVYCSSRAIPERRTAPVTPSTRWVVATQIACAIVVTPHIP